MTPKEKAQELVIKFGDYTVQKSWRSKDYFALECALIAVDEILKVSFYATDEIYNFYLEVKQEIELL